MAKTAVIYRLADDALLGIVSLARDSDLPLNYDPDTAGCIEIPADHPIRAAQARWRVAGGALVEKATVTLTADHPQFPADGASECRITAAGLVAQATVLVNGQAVPLAPADPVLILTSDSPARFRVEVKDPLHWAAPLTVEAV